MPRRQQKEARQETGGLLRSQDPASRDGERAALEAHLSALEALSAAELRIEWRRLYRAEPPVRLSRDLLLRGAAFRLQENAHGGLSRSTERRLRALFEAEQRGAAAPCPAITLKPGTRLVREWHGQLHTVAVLDDGFEYQDQHYNSLTGIALRITGVHRSGPLFFGIRKRAANG